MTAETKKRILVPTILTLLTFGVVGLYISSAQSAEGADQSTEAKDQEAKDEQDGEEKEEEEKAPIPVEIAEIETGFIASYISSTANLVPENQVRVLAEWDGRVAGLKVEEGDYVKKGEVLAELAREDGEIAVAKAEVQAKTARLAFERGESLREQQLLSPEDFDKLQRDHDLAEQTLAETKWRLEKTYIRSPFTGRITERLVQLGQHVRPGDDLFVVADFEPLVARLYVPETDVLTLEQGREVRISLKADDAITFEGRIQRISPVVDTATGTVKVTVEASDPPRQVRPGAFVQVDIIREARPDAVLLPREAVIRELQKAYVFVAQDGVAEKRPIELGLEERKTVQALTGVARGEQVIVAGQGGLRDGSAVKLIGEDGEQPVEAEMQEAETQEADLQSDADTATDTDTDRVAVS